jgi:hypothetical protein
VGPDDGAHAAIEVEAHGVLLGRDLAVEVDEPDRRQRLGALVEQPIRLDERVVERLHERPADEVHDGEVRSVERLVDPPAAARDAVRAVVERPEDPLLAFEDRVDLALVPDVVPGRDDVDAGIEQRPGGRFGQPGAARDVLAVRDDEVDPALVAQASELALDRLPTWLADDVADEQDATGAGPARRVAVGRRAETGPTGLGRPGLGGHRSPATSRTRPRGSRG